MRSFFDETIGRTYAASQDRSGPLPPIGRTDSHPTGRGDSGPAQPAAGADGASRSLPARRPSAASSGSRIKSTGALGVATILFLVTVSINAEEPMIVAHRGASRDAPENTLPAFRLAWEQGADAIEGDFHQTGDGRIVCIHDKDTERVADRSLTVEESTLEELRTLDVGAHRGEEYRGTVIPTIAEVFATIPEQKKIYVEIKSGESILPNLLNEIEKSGLQREQVIVISFDTNVIRAFKTMAPRYKAFWLSGFRKGPSGKILPSIQTVLGTLKRIEADGFSSSKEMVDEAFVQSILGKGYEYHVWTVDDIPTAVRFKKWGAESITTNVPGYLRKHLDAGGPERLDIE